MSIVTKNESGTVRTEMMASSGLIQTIMASTPMTVRMEVTNWVRVCWRVVAILSMSFVTRLRRSPRGVES
ncbi:unannotated protein [freshwater metagenome]|uniref:Unannotated protein n=1 Tax=freshwater metagenome TaxID=449393 RepID=A0A6J7Q0X4_9ZZZZ